MIDESNAPSTLQEVQELLKTKAKELLFCQPQNISTLTQEIQRLRIVAALFSEIENRLQDPNLYKEMNLLNRMTTGKDLESEQIRRRADEEIEAAREKLERHYGVSPDSANRIARAIATVAGRNDIVEELDGPDDQLH